VKLARDLENGEKVAIKIVQRFSKKRRLGKLTVSPEEKTKREIAILKKIRHPNVVGLYEVIDDPDYKKIYMVLEYVELGEIKWRKKGTPQICAFERRRIERGLRGEEDVGDEEKLFKMLERRRMRKDAQRARLAQQQQQQPSAEFWSLEHGDDEDGDFAGDATPLSRVSTRESLFAPRSYQSHTSLARSNPGSKSASATSRAPSRTSSVAHRTPQPVEFDIGPIDSDNEDNEDETPGPLPSISSTHSSGAGFFGHVQDPANRGDDPITRGRSPSVGDSIISHMSSVDDVIQHDSFEEDFSYVPCFTLDQARSTFRDTVLGLEYLHYEGIVHRDIKPANLLWTREHRVKISDFGVSYFGRPVRDGEPEENLSESDAQDFDDDLELSKTVGTPAFFAPELCYTDLDAPQPKINDQIDVWSLGVTLYCLIFARIPFLAEDEYQLFRAIAQQDVYIPRRRLRAVDPGSLHPDYRIPEGAYREDGELVMEYIDDELYDLIRRMLIKDPAERIRLREVKRHPWVLRGIDNVIGWLDDTDPSRTTAGQRIQVDDRELERAVVPISFVQRARSAVKKAVGKVLGLGEGSRKRAVSTATSSGDGGSSSPQTPARDRDARRASIRGDESYFSSLFDHPLSHSVTASPQRTPHPNSDVKNIESEPISMSSSPKILATRPPAPERSISTAGTIKTAVPALDKASPLTSPNKEPPVGSKFSPEVTTTIADHLGSTFRDTIRLKNTRSMDLMKNSSGESAGRARSADMALFSPGDKHVDASTGVTKAITEAAKHSLFGHHHSRSMEICPTTDHGHAHHVFRPTLLSQHKQSISNPIVGTLNYAASLLDNRPLTASRTPEARTPPRLWEPSTPDSLQKEQEQLEAHRRSQEEVEKRRGVVSRGSEMKHAQSQRSYPPSPAASPRDASFSQPRYQDTVQGKSSSSINSYGVRSPSGTSASNLTSPISSATLDSAQLESCNDPFPSHPSLPALVSGGSSVSADQESNQENDPVTQDPMQVFPDSGSPDTVTPSLSKLSSHEEAQAPVILDLNKCEEQMRHEMYAAEAQRDFEEPPDHYSRDADDSDSDEGLTMGRRKGKPAPKSGSNSDRSAGNKGRMERRHVERRNTNNSVGSTGTAKKIVMDD